MAWKKTTNHVTRETITIDATGKIVGRLASEIARLLMGKDKATYVPHVDSGAIIKVTHADKLALTGKKMEQKVIHRSSNRPHGVKSTPVSRLQVERPGYMLVHAVKYMLPKNHLQSERMKRLIIV
jgi:large subunit ribosomal protein L13